MSVKKKLLIALLSATCLTAGAFGLAACDKDDGDKAQQEDGLKKAYQTYKENAGESALGYDEWLLTIQSAGGIKVNGAEWNEDGEIILTYGDGSTQTIDLNNQTIKTHAFDKNGDLVITFKDGTTTTIAMPKTYTAYAVDNNGDPVSGAWLSIGYFDKSYMFVDVAHTKTNDYGVASFSFIPKASTEYIVKISDTMTLKINEVPIPAGYTVDFGESLGFPLSYTDVDENRQAVVNFKTIPGAFIDSNVKNLNYSRRYNENTPASPDETYEPLDLELEKGINSYFGFCPYVNLGGGDNQEDTQVLLDNATKAAIGMYKISFTVTEGSATVEMCKYSGSRAFMLTDANGIPLDSAIINKTGDGTSYTDSTSITLNLHSELVNNDNIFGIKADADCKVRITVERTGDSVEPPKVETTVKEVTGTPVKWTDDEKTAGGQLTLMPLTGSLNIVKDTDGFYRVGSESGPHLLVNLTKQISRIGDQAIVNMPAANERGDAVFIKSVYGGEYNFLQAKYDYNNIVKAYAKLVNSDGVYGVNDDLKEFLEFFGGMTYGAADIINDKPELCWLIPCQYYVPSNGLPADGSGTEADPFIALDIKNGVNAAGISDDAYIKFTASASALYKFEVNEGELNFGGVNTVVSGGLTYVPLKIGESVVCTIAGGKNYSVTVSSDEILAPVYDVQYQETTGGGSVEVDNSKGTTEANAISVLGSGVKAYQLDGSVCENGLYIKFRVLGNGTYKFDLGESNSARISYDGHVYSGNELEIQAVTGTTYTLLLTTELNAGAIVDGIYLLNIVKQ